LAINPVSIPGEFRPKETRLAMESRLAMERAKADHEQAVEIRRIALEEWRDRLILKSGLAILCVVGVYCLVINLLPGQSTEQRAWATATLTGIVSGLVGYFVGTAKK
jgi:hypothetical protein